MMFETYLVELSTRVTSTDLLLHSRRYLAAVAPAMPPPTTTTRLDVAARTAIGAKATREPTPRVSRKWRLFIMMDFLSGRSCMAQGFGSLEK